LALATPVVGAQQAEAIAQVIGTLETLGDIGVLMSMLSQPTGIFA
jgi:hypothetical protein